MTRIQKEQLVQLFTRSKIKVSNAEESKKIQEIAFKAGWSWDSAHPKKVSFETLPYLFFWDDKQICFSFSLESFDRLGTKEITYKQIMDVLETKAYIIYSKSMLDSIDSAPIIYADSPSKAKAKALKLGYLDCKYIDLAIKRIPEEDKVEFYGKFISKRNKENNLKERQKYLDSFNKIKELPNDSLFLVQNGFVGNDMLFWKQNNAGYSCNIKEAQVYTKIQLFQMLPLKDNMKIWNYYYIMENLSLVCNSQCLDCKERI